MGVDSSTQSTKVEIRDADTGELVASGRSPHPPTSPPCSEQNPEAWWEALRGAIAQTGQSDIAAISVAAQQHGLVALDSAGDILRPAKLWNDTESAPDAASLVNQLGAEAWAREVGSVPGPAFTVTKLAWLRRNEPDVFDRLALALLPHDWLTFKLTGLSVTDRGDASGTGYFSTATESWSATALSSVADNRDWESHLPRVLGPNDTAGEITTAAAEALGIDTGAVIAPGTGDNMAAALGLSLEHGDVVVSIGTSGTVYATSPRPTADSSGAVAGFADADSAYLPLVCTLNATRVTDAFARILGVEEEWLSRMAIATPAGAHGVSLLPYLDGERTPNRPEATGTMAGIRTSSTPEDIARAAFEGVILGLLDGVEALARAGIDTSTGRMRLIGGGSRSDAYRRVLADLAARPVTIPVGDEHVAAGACVQAAAVLRGIDISRISSEWGLGRGQLVEPDSQVDTGAVRSRYRDLRGQED